MRLQQQLTDPSQDPTSNEGEDYGIKVQTRYKTENATTYTLVSNPYGAAKSYDAGGESTMGWTLSTQDRLGRTTKVETFAGATLPQPWDANANSTGASVSTFEHADTVLVADTADQSAKKRRITSDGLGRPKTVVEDPDTPAPQGSYSTGYTYPPNQMVVAQGAQTQTRTITYDSLSRTIGAANPESGTICYGTYVGEACHADYDANGNLLHKTDARGVLTTYAYDALNRLTRRDYNDGTPSAAFCYDGTMWSGAQCSTSRTAPNYGLLTWAGSLVTGTPNSTRYYPYNVLGLPTSVKQTTDSLEFITDYTYNLAGNVTGIIYPSLGGAARRQVAWNYRASNYSGSNPAGALDTITGTKTGEANKTYLAASTYAPFGGLASRQIGDPLTSRYQHVNLNSRFQATEIGLGTSPTSTSLLGLNFTYYPNGNVQNQIITAPGFGTTQTYGYDAVNRLTSAIETNGWFQTFGYDQYGNQWISGHNLPNSVVNALTPTSQGWYNPLTNRITGFGYDNAGNQTSAVGGNNWTMSYDANNRMTGARYGTMYAGALSYVYDALGQRVKKTVDQTSGIYVYDVGGQLLAEYTKNSGGSYTLLKEFVYGGGLLATELVRSATTEYTTTDHLGSTRVTTDASGNVVSRHDYLPFGKEVPVSYGRSGVAGYIPPEQERVLQRFTGDEVDPETGLGYFVNRYYSGRMGRFTSPDPLGIASADLTNPQTLNAYAYVYNNPLLYTDPLGLDAAAVICRVVVEDGTIRLICYYSGGDGATGGGGGGPNASVQWFFLCSLHPSLCSRSGPALRGPRDEGGGTTGGGTGVKVPAGTATLSAGRPDDRNDYCTARGRAKVVADWVPGSSGLVRNLWGSRIGEALGFYQLSTADLNRITEENHGGQTVAMHAASEALKTAEESTALLYALRAKTGVPMTLAGKVLGRAAWAVTVFDLGSGWYKGHKEADDCRAGN